MSRFGDLLRQLRTARGLTQAELASKVGISHVYVSALETGRRSAPPHAVVSALASCLGIPIEELWSTARTERALRLELRIDGTATSLRRHKLDSGDKQAGPGEQVETEAAILSLLGDTLSPEDREQKARLLESLAHQLRASKGSQPIDEPGEDQEERR